jgi:hypothetical protein
VIGVREVYYQDEGVPGVGEREECPKETTTYSLRVIKLDGSEHIEEITVQVINPIVSSGTIVVNPGETVDFDVGNIPGDDFRWSVDGEIRKFEVLKDVLLAPKGESSSLETLTLAECASADYSQYTFIDGSDVVSDTTNALTDGRTACYRTNQDRFGKLRFPERSTGSLKTEWLTWK